MDLKHQKPPTPPENTVIPASHPWAQYWINVAIDACKANGAKWKPKGTNGDRTRGSKRGGT
jgi:hypothetical protein